MTPIDLNRVLCPICGTYLIDHHEWPKHYYKCPGCGYSRPKPDTPKDFKPKKKLY